MLAVLADSPLCAGNISAHCLLADDKIWLSCMTLQAEH